MESDDPRMFRRLCTASIDREWWLTGTDIETRLTRLDPEEQSCRKSAIGSSEAMQGRKA